MNPSILPTQVTVEFSDYRDFVAEFAPRIGSEGLFLPTTDPAEIGASVSFRFVLAADDIVLLQGNGEVVWSVEGPEPGMAIRFTKLDPLTRELVERLVKRQAAGGGSAFSLEREAPDPRNEVAETLGEAEGADRLPGSVEEQLSAVYLPPLEEGASSVEGSEKFDVFSEPELQEGSIEEEVVGEKEEDQPSPVSKPAPEEAPRQETWVRERPFAFDSRATGFDSVEPPLEDVDLPETSMAEYELDGEFSEASGRRGRARWLTALAVALAAALGVAWWCFSLRGEAAGPAPEERVSTSLGESGSSVAPLSASAEPAAEPTLPEPPLDADVSENGSKPLPTEEPAEGDSELRAPVTDLPFLPAAPKEVPSSSFTRVLRVEVSRSLGATEVIVVANGEIPAGRLRDVAMGQSRHLVVLRGVTGPLSPPNLHVGTPQIEQVRTGYHPDKPSGPEFHVVVDIATPGVRMVEKEVAGDRLRFRFE